MLVAAALVGACVVSPGPLETGLVPATTPLDAYPVATAMPPTAGTSGIPPEKLTAIALATLSPTFTPVPVGTPVLGIIEGVAPPYNTDVFRSGNQWNGYIGDTLTHVFVGARSEDPQQGVVIVEHPTLGGWFDTPETHGMLRITAADGNILTLVAVDGFVYHFDVSTDSYVDLEVTAEATQSAATAAAP
jgi:hypothetical protein